MLGRTHLNGSLYIYMLGGNLGSILYGDVSVMFTFGQFFIVNGLLSFHDISLDAIGLVM